MILSFFLFFYFFSHSLLGLVSPSFFLSGARRRERAGARLWGDFFFVFQEEIVDNGVPKLFFSFFLFPLTFFCIALQGTSTGTNRKEPTVGGDGIGGEGEGWALMKIFHKRSQGSKERKGKEKDGEGSGRSGFRERW